MVPTEVDVSVPVDGAPAARRRWPRVVWLACGLGALVGYATLPWEWSFIDDTGALAILHGQQDAHGTLGGILGAAHVWYRLDLDWGLFRPAWWLYGGGVFAPAGGGGGRPAARVGRWRAARAGLCGRLLRAPACVWVGRAAGA